MRVLAIIPARGGSKGVPGKNKRKVAGRALIGYTLEAARESRELSSIYVSSDDDEILEIAKSYPCKLHRRSKELSTDESPVVETVKAILALEGEAFDAVLLLQPTSPLRTGDDIDNAIQMLKQNDEVQSVMSVVPMDDIHPARMYKLSEDEALDPFIPEYEEVRRQDIPVVYYRNGSIYLTRTKALLENGSVMNKPIKPYVMDFKWWLNIDSERDLFIAEAIIPVWSSIFRK